MKPIRSIIQLGRFSLMGTLFLMTLTAGASRAAGLQSRFAPFEGGRVHYEVSGTGDEALVFVHGWTCNADFWRGQTAAFSSTPIIAVDLPGHGQSDKPQTDY